MQKKKSLPRKNPFSLFYFQEMTTLYDFTVKNIKGEEWNLADLKGKVKETPNLFFLFQSKLIGLSLGCSLCQCCLQVWFH